MRLIDADARVTVQSFDVEHEEYDHTEMSVEDALDFATDEGCPAVVKAIPLAWFNKMIHACGTQGNIDAVRALRWVMEAWKMTEEIWDDEKDCRNTVRMTVLEKTINDLHKYVNYPKPLCDIVSNAILCPEAVKWE